MNVRVIKCFFIAASFAAFYPLACPAQYFTSNKLDSLFSVNRNHPTKDAAKVDLLNAISWQYYIINQRDSAYYYARSASALGRKIGYKRGVATAYRFLGNCYSVREDTPSALKYYQNALSISKEINDLRGLINNNRNLGLMYFSDYSKSQGYYLRALKFAREMKSPHDIGLVYNDLGNLSRQFFDYPQALSYYNKGITAFRKTKDWITMATAHGNTGAIFLILGDTTKAIAHLRQELALARKSGNKGMTANALSDIAAYYTEVAVHSTDPKRKSALLEEAVSYLHQAIDISRALNDVVILVKEYGALAHAYLLQENYVAAIVYLKKGREIAKKMHNFNGAYMYHIGMGSIIAAAPDSVLLGLDISPDGRNRKAIEQGKKALTIARQRNIQEQIAETLQFLTPLYEKTGNYKAAYLILKEYTDLKDKAVGLNRQKEIVRKEMQFKFEQETAALNTEHEKEVLRQRIIRNALIGGVILLLIFSVIVFLQRKKTIKARLRAERSERQKQRFFTNISHEFRTPLTLLMGPLDDLMHGGSVEDFKAVLPEMHRNSQRLLRLINQLLDISRLDAEKYRVNPSRTDIIPFTQQIVHGFSSLARAKDITLEMEAEPGLADRMAKAKTHFYFDEDVIDKIITNLLSNAFKYTPSQGRIAVSLSIAEDQPNALLFKVQDSGAGIPDEVLPRIFDRFYRVESQYPQGSGSGIGLALVQELVEVHGGQISVKSNDGAGTTFYCLFPLSKKEAVNRPLSPPQKKSDQVPIVNEEMGIVDTTMPMNGSDGEGKPVVLVVEDEQDIRRYMRAKLKEHYEVLEAQNGKQGLQIAEERLPALVISDVMMPEMDGFALCSALKTDPKTSHIPVILLTARAEDRDKMTGLQTGADAYLIKPFNSKELVVRAGHLIALRNKMRAKFSSRLLVRPAEIAVTSLDRELIDKLLKAVDAHLDDAKFSVDNLSAAVNMSTRQLNRKLKTIIGQSPLQFIRSVRLQRAMEMLKNNSGNISDIAFKTGFETPSYFTKRFKEQFGCLPSEKEKFPEDI